MEPEKIKNRYSPRGWYEVELILNKGTEAANILPTGKSFTVVTDDGYSFNLSRQGDYNKNLRSDSNLKILGTKVSQVNKYQLACL